MSTDFTVFDYVDRARTWAPLTTSAAVPLAPDATPMIVDTDMAPDDWMAILYLLQRPDADVKAITVAGTGEVHCEPGVHHARALAALAGRPQIPVGCGPEKPLAGNHVFPERWRNRADTLAGLRLPGSIAPTAGQNAVALLTGTLLTSPQPVTVVTLGPLTFVPLDATNQAPITSAFYARLASDRTTPAAEFVHRVLTTQLSLIRNGLYWFWDPLTAAVSVDKGVARTVERKVSVLGQEGPEVGATRFVRDGTPAQVVTSIDAARFETQFLDTLNARFP